MAVMRDSAMRDDQFVSAGPYRYVRNPLYLGSWLLAGGASILMPPSGAAFFLLAFSAFVLFLISAEERFLSAKLGDVYQQYCRRVPRLLPRLGAGDGARAGTPELGAGFFCRGLSACLHVLLRDLRVALQRARPHPVSADLLRLLTGHARVYREHRWLNAAYPHLGCRPRRNGVFFLELLLPADRADLEIVGFLQKGVP